MYKLSPFFVFLAIVFTSCSSNQEETFNNTQDKLLQSYTLKRDANGAYSIDFNTTNNTDVVTVKNAKKSNNIILSEVNHKTAIKHSSKLPIEKDQLKVGFLDENKGKRTRISIEDDNIMLTKGGVNEFLNSYNITEKEDGTFLLNFKVNDNVATTFVYNEDIQTYEVHLSKGKVKQKKFSRTISTPSANLIRLDFVNHKYSGRSTKLAYIRKPRVEIIVD